MDLSCQQEWNKFSSMISGEQLNLGEVQLYVDTLPGGIPVYNKPNFDFSSDNKPPFLSKLKK